MKDCFEPVPAVRNKGHRQTARWRPNGPSARFIPPCPRFAWAVHPASPNRQPGARSGDGPAPSVLSGQGIGATGMSRSADLVRRKMLRDARTTALVKLRRGVVMQSEGRQRAVSGSLARAESRHSLWRLRTIGMCDEDPALLGTGSHPPDSSFQDVHGAVGASPSRPVGSERRIGPGLGRNRCRPEPLEQ